MLKNKAITKTALVVSLLLLCLWNVLGAKATIAWFQESDTIVNNLNFGDLKVNLYYKTGEGYVAVDSMTRLFNEEALYEPGYTQIVYFQVENAGSLDFTYTMSVIPDLTSVVVGKNEKGQDIYLPDYLKFGLVISDTEESLFAITADRDLARTYATEKLSNYSKSGDVLAAGESHYCALILYMPETVGNEANYRGDAVPRLEVGVGVTANQLN